VRLGPVVLTPPVPVTADQLRAIMPHAGAAADRYVDALNRAMTAHGINTPASALPSWRRSRPKAGICMM